MKRTLKGFVKRTKEKDTPEKDKVRKETVQFICDYFTEKKQDHIQFLTLPSAWWRFEISVTGAFASRHGRDADVKIPYIRFIGCERDWTLYCLGVHHMPVFQGMMKQKNNLVLNCQEVTNSYNYVFFHIDIFEYMRLIQDRKSPGDRKMDVIWLDTVSAISYIDDKLQYLENVIKPGSIVVLTVLKAREHKKLPMARLEYIESIMNPMGLKLLKKFEYFDSSPMLHLIYMKS